MKMEADILVSYRVGFEMFLKYHVQYLSNRLRLSSYICKSHTGIWYWYRSDVEHNGNILIAQTFLKVSDSNI